MFPLNSNDQYIDDNGKRSTLGNAIGSGGGGDPYILPTATAERLGGVKIGDGVDVSEDGTISVSSGGGGSEIKYYDATMNSKSYTAKTWTDGIVDISGITDYANKHYISVVARDESGFTAVLADTELTLTNYISVNVYALNAATNKALKVRIFYY